MPCNSYGINDNYDLNSLHFLPALIRKIIEALKNNKDHYYLGKWQTFKRVNIL